MLTTSLSASDFVQYNSANDVIFTNVRIHYNPREGNDLYIVYDEGLNTYRQREIPALPRTSIRTILVKYSYTFNIGGWDSGKGSSGCKSSKKYYVPVCKFENNNRKLFNLPT